jgi:periplasmic copper chaperone A
MRNSRMRAACGAGLTAFALMAAGCSGPAQHDEPMAASVSFSDEWANSAETGMASVFGTLTNVGDHDARIVSATSPAAGVVEIHEVAPDATGAKTMRPKAGGVVVPAGGTHDLAPGGDHLMLMDLKEPLHPGADVSLTVVFEDGSTLPVTAQVRDFAGGHEHYESSPESDAAMPAPGHG